MWLSTPHPFLAGRALSTNTESLRAVAGAARRSAGVPRPSPRPRCRRNGQSTRGLGDTAHRIRRISETLGEFGEAQFLGHSFVGELIKARGSVFVSDSPC